VLDEIFNFLFGFTDTAGTAAGSENKSKIVGFNHWVMSKDIIKTMKSGLIIQTLFTYTSFLFLVSCIGVTAERNRGDLEKKYRFDVASTIQENWNAPKLNNETLKRLNTSIIITVLLNGDLKNIYLYKLSGNDFWDNSAIEAVKKANPFKPFPKGISAKELKIGINFTPNRNNNNPTIG
jgi:TonB family protein